MKRLLIALAALSVAWNLTARQPDREAERLSRVAGIIKTVMTVPGRSIPVELIQHAHCIGVIPSALNIELGLGAHFGRGALMCRVENGEAWSAPWMFTVGGASYGLIPEGESADVVFLVMTSSSERKFSQGCVRVGIDVSQSPGPVVAPSGITTLTLPRSSIVAYSISQGKFAGTSLQGIILKPDDDANLRLYGHKVEPGTVLTDAAFPAPAQAIPLEKMLATYCSPKHRAAKANP